MSDITYDTDKLERVAQLNELAHILPTLIEERAVAFADDPLGKTGLYNRTFKIRGTRKHPVIEEAYSYDLALIQRHIKILNISSKLTRPSAKTSEDARQADCREVIRRIHKGRQRCAEEGVERQAQAAKAKAEKQLEASNPQGNDAIPSPV